MERDKNELNTNITILPNDLHNYLYNMLSRRMAVCKKELANVGVGRAGTLGIKAKRAKYEKEIITIITILELMNRNHNETKNFINK